jgi:hypothetical protein
MTATQNVSHFSEAEGLALEGQSQFSGVGRLLSAVSTVLHETLDRFENASGQVTQTVLTRGNPADHDLIQALQNFDRIHQEFSAIKHMITHCATASAEGHLTDSERWGQDAVAGITLTDVKQRLLACLGESMMPQPVVDEPMGEEAVF